MTIDELSNWIKKNRIGEIACMVPDFSGAGRGKSMTPAQFLDVYNDNGLRLPEAAHAINVHGGFTFNDYIDRTERDSILECDLTTLHMEPWTQEKTAGIICDSFTPEGKPLQIAPRQVLKNVIELYHQRGWNPVVGPEVEFYLIAAFEGMILEPKAPKGATGLSEFGQYTYSLDAIDEFDAFFEEIYEFAEQQGILIDTLIHEDGPCQFEINLRHTDALKVADQLFLFKRLARHVGARHKLFVTFMAKPYAKQSGSSMHLHQSVVDKKTGTNIFANADGSDSELFNYFIGGLQTHLPTAMPFIAPYTNSYNRFEAFMSAPTNVHWSRENRTVGLRVPESSAAGRRIENRICGSDVNPYFAIAASLLCGYIGMDQKIPRREEFVGQSYDDTDRPLPQSLTEALDLFRGSEMLRHYMGDAIIETFADVKQAEYEHRSSVLSPWDVRYLMVNV